MTITLTLTTSTPHGSLVLRKGSRLVKELTWHKEKSHSEKITTQLQELFKDTELSLKDVNLLICTKGPGSFTGIRVGLSVIRTLAYAHNLPVIALDDGIAIATNSLKNSSQLPVLVMLDAQKNKVFTAIYKREQGQLLVKSPPQLTDVELLREILSEKQYLCLGDGFNQFKDFISPEVSQKLVRDTQIGDSPQALEFSQYVLEHLEQFEKIKWNEVEPLYLRASAAEEVRAQKMS